LRKGLVYTIIIMFVKNIFILCCLHSPEYTQYYSLNCFYFQNEFNLNWFLAFSSSFLRKWKPLQFVLFVLPKDSNGTAEKKLNRGQNILAIFVREIFYIFRNISSFWKKSFCHLPSYKKQKIRQFQGLFSSLQFQSHSIIWSKMHLQALWTWPSFHQWHAIQMFYKFIILAAAKYFIRDSYKNFTKKILEFVKISRFSNR